MKGSFLSYKEEERNAKIFLWVLYVILSVYQISYAIVLENKALIENWHRGMWQILCGVAILCVNIYLVKREKANFVKYTCIFVYIGIEIINIISYILYNKVAFEATNIIEIILIFFVPIFINKRFFVCVLVTIIGKYLIYLFVLEEVKAFMFLIMYTLVLIAAYIILNRFIQYLLAVKKSIKIASESQKLAVVGKMAASVGHEIKNPLASLKGFTQLQREKHGKDPVYKQMIFEIENMNSMISELMEVATCKPSIYKKQNIGEIALQAVTIVREKMNESNIQLISNVEEKAIEVECDERKIRGVVLYVMKNALEAMEQGGVLDLRLENKGKDYVMLSVIDNGYGIKKENLERVKEAFYTTKQDKIGLGLTVADRIVNEHLGKLHISSERDKGTRIDIILPKKCGNNEIQVGEKLGVTI
ncbi:MULTISPECIES: ATP-binding protein [Bacillus]|uniref:histidine kinase n=2 Tax=Bacillus cereus group TaxID=86661 RepID=A0A2A7D5B9_BACAN|nr:MULTISPECIES: ATP-binding protein [Bacillus]MCP1165900.1 ATP-binding protein [Bacillus sp. 1813sda1]MDC7975684.1 ATP-binding protein [Bacillus sp. BLCC-B18]OTW68555.1 two-component sensor histidine kinase [Bacillus thuringiensis serovar coreanensis]OTX42129.1 two-component sensor histidine kinase [Bacillus thuringiensis serovar sooncheon]OTX51354.1 two-component sensor histidine kinase [Bacillus thuringiensis serovar guiyangiensis]